MHTLTEERLAAIRKAELLISRNLFITCAAITVITMAMIIIEFFSRGNFFPSRIGFFYVGILFIYSAHKELLRWMEEKGKDRMGEAFFYSWIFLTTFLYIVNFLSKDYYGLSLSGKPLGCMSDVAFITLEVGVIFLLARVSKVVKVISVRNRQK